ncbi:hypothetical protein HFP89_01845 [Wenzhouxiangella sp. XN79A]|uniref:hypothetical protein n=1 Tax=Wenzhouxiangella sp. XN79A TaxID=2724193 RepID=UPI00144A8D5F|nr:hypothetical protein [Wenzhouxiangella sp. XN79A]NKI33906.1 hypothetical protein [Wenzhouxiangella sp. XN79A]
MAELIDDYKAIATKLGLPEMQTGSFRREETRDFASSQDALAHLRDSRPECGWLLFQSWQGAFVEGFPEIDDAWGHLLAADLVLEDRRSARIEHLPAYGWRVIVLAHDDGASGLWDRVTHLLRDPADAALHYRRYWTLDAEHGCVQVGAMLTSIETDPGRS